MRERKLAMNRAMIEALQQEMARDESVFLLGEDVGAYGGIFATYQRLIRQFGEDRVLDTPISEAGFMGLAMGAAAEGRRPVVDLMFVDFFGACGDQLLNQIGKTRYMSGGQVTLPMVILTGMGGGYNDAASHSQCIYSIFAHMPGMKIVVPSNAYDAKGLLIRAIRDDDPVMYFFHKKLLGLTWLAYPPAAGNHVPEDEYEIPFGQAAVVREGSDVTIVGISMTVHDALGAADLLQGEGISAEVLDVRTLVPLDKDALLQSVAKTGRLVVADEDYLRWGMSGEIAAIVAEEIWSDLKAPVRRVAHPMCPIPYGRNMENACLPNAETIARAVREWF